MQEIFNNTQNNSMNKILQNMSNNISEKMCYAEYVRKNSKQ
jgi:hypothetical protein